MISKSCCFKLMKEDIKRRLWLIALLALVFTFLYPVGVTTIISNYKDNLDRGLWRVMDYFSAANGFLAFILVISSVVSGISSFSYLNSKKKVDFFHSIPVKRDSLFWSHYFDGILIVLLLFYASVAVSLSIVSMNGFLTVGMLKTVVLTLGFHSCFFILLYSVVTVAVMMTGNMLVNLLATAVFFLYFPSTAALVEGYVQTWFKTYCNNDILSTIAQYTSPLIYYIVQMDNLWDYGGTLECIAAPTAVGISCVMMFLSLWLYRKRPSEAAGKAMAFEKTKTPIKVLLVMSFSMAGCLLFWGIHGTAGWSVFGLLTAGILTHCIIEIIYSYDFRNLFANKLHLLVCMLASIFLFLGSQYDILGYDRYIPKAESLESVAVYFNGVDDWVTYGKPSIEKTVDGDEYYYWNYENQSSYVLKNMEIKQTEPVLDLIKKVMEETDDRSGHNDYDRYSFYIRYRLKSGREVSRRYTIPQSDFSQLGPIVDDIDFKEGMYPVLHQTIDSTAAVAYQEMDVIRTLPTKSTAEMEMLLVTYQKELRGLTLETRKKENPIGMIQFQTPEHQKASANKNNKDGSIAQRAYYPVYPSFQETIALLKSYGLNPGNELDEKKITNIWVADKSISGDSESTAISSLYPYLIPFDYAQLNWFYIYDGGRVDVTVDYGEGFDHRTYEYVIDSKYLPDGF